MTSRPDPGEPRSWLMGGPSTARWPSPGQRSRGAFRHRARKDVDGGAPSSTWLRRSRAAITDIWIDRPTPIARLGHDGRLSRRRGKRTGPASQRRSTTCGGLEGYYVSATCRMGPPAGQTPRGSRGGVAFGRRRERLGRRSRPVGLVWLRARERWRLVCYDVVCQRVQSGRRPLVAAADSPFRVDLPPRLPHDATRSTSAARRDDHRRRPHLQDGPITRNDKTRQHGAASRRTTSV
jgi:hypothetical protein